MAVDKTFGINLLTATEEMCQTIWNLQERVKEIEKRLNDLEKGKKDENNVENCFSMDIE